MFDAFGRWRRRSLHHAAHGMVLVKAHGERPTEIWGCRCGWRAKPYKGDSDAQLSRHIAGSLVTRLTGVIADAASRPQQGGGLSVTEDLWRSFTHTELSLIASHLAGGGSFCCQHNAEQRARVTDNLRKRDRLAEFAHEAMGCRSRGASDDTWRGESAHYLAKFLDSVGGGR
jgi:hypothetical protein